MNIRSLILGAVLAVSAAAHAGVVYQFDRAVGGGHVSGSIETDGTLGALGEGNLLGWSITVSGADINGGVATTSVTGYAHRFSGVVATATDLLFDFSAGNVLYFYTASSDFWCIAGSDTGCFVPGAEVLGYADSKAFGEAYSVLYRGVQSFAAVGEPNAVPEPGSVALLGLGLAALAVARKRKPA